MPDKCGTKSSRCQECSLAGTCSDDEKEKHEQQRLDAIMGQIKYKFMVLSGKGGVGKSSVAVNLATMLAQEGFSVGIMDADIHGPNIPKMLGVEEHHLVGSAEGLLPIMTKGGVKVVSVAFFLRSKEDAIIWRGPMKHSLIKQFVGEVFWGPLDYLLIDLPPGTGDEALSTAHVIRDVDGAIIVTTPQDVALLDARKSVTFCRQLRIPVIGIVENMSGFICPHCEKEIDIFKVGGGERAAAEMNVPFLGRIPLEPGIVDSTDTGTPYVTLYPGSTVAESFRSIAAIWRELLESQRQKSSGAIERGA